MAAATVDESRLRSKFGTFGGVFTPNVLTILGVIMFLRFGQITGQAGVGHAILILLCAKLITSLTSFSLAPIATNTRVKGGGAYYLISRSLGVDFGGGRQVDVEAVFECLAHALVTVAGKCDLAVGIAQVQLQQLGYIPLIFDNQYFSPVHLT